MTGIFTVETLVQFNVFIILKMQVGLFRNLRFFDPPLDARYGTSSSAQEYSEKAQVATYESHRALFEGYSRNKYISTGLKKKIFYY